AGALAMPVQKEVFFTMGEEGSFVNGTRLNVTPTSIKDSLIACGFSEGYADKDSRRREYENFGRVNDMSRGCMRTGSAATNISYVAAGRFQAAYGIDNKMWDVAGAIAVALGAGCSVYTDRKERSFNVSYVVGAPGVSEELVKIVHSGKLAELQPL
ncbi:MAG: hypothetical protein JW994_07440, partial [Candidatus Omnitrophica bacterium]|nr:hypothetical protein [Candidatus Omnitrophota bacterium]